MERDLVIEFARVTEAAAINCAKWIGRMEKNSADGAAVEAMRKMFDTIHISGTVVIGEGEMDEAPMLYIGEKVGLGGTEVDIAVDPLEGTNLTAKNQPGAIAVMAVAEAAACSMRQICTWIRSSSAHAPKAPSTSTRPSKKISRTSQQPSARTSAK